MSEVVNRVVDIQAIKPHPENYNNHPDSQLQAIGMSLESLGQFRSVVLWQQHDGSYIQLAGHGVVEAMRREGKTEVRADVHPPTLDPMAAKQIMLADNLHAQNSVADDEALVALLQEQQDAGFSLEALGSDEDTLRQMLESLGEEYAGGAGDEREEDDEEVEVDEEQTRVKPGDVWQLGRHVIACINSCDADAVQKLVAGKPVSFVFADPPYGISIVATNGYVGGGEAYDIPFGGVKNRARGDVGGTASHMRKTGRPYIAEQATKRLGSPNGAKPFGGRDSRGSIGGKNPPGSKNNLRSDPKIDVGKYAPVIGDETTATAITSSELCLQMFPDAIQVWWGANYYAHMLPPSKCWIVWDKENTGNFADAELAWCSHDSVVRIFKHMWNGLMKDSEKGQRRVHPTQKPIALAEWCFEKYGKEDDVIFDPFLGSGISIIAAERLAGTRSVIGCELSPDYINVVISRWEKETNQEAVLLERDEVMSHA